MNRSIVLLCWAFCLVSVTGTARADRQTYDTATNPRPVVGDDDEPAVWALRDAANQRPASPSGAPEHSVERHSQRVRGALRGIFFRWLERGQHQTGRVVRMIVPTRGVHRD